MDQPQTIGSLGMSVPNCVIPLMVCASTRWRLEEIAINAVSLLKGEIKILTFFLVKKKYFPTVFMGLFKIL